MTILLLASANERGTREGTVTLCFAQSLRAQLRQPSEGGLKQAWATDRLRARPAV